MSSVRSTGRKPHTGALPLPALIVLLLAGCGQKGPLIRPDETPAAVPAVPAAPAARAAAAGQAVDESKKKAGTRQP